MGEVRGRTTGRGRARDIGRRARARQGGQLQKGSAWQERGAHDASLDQFQGGTLWVESTPSKVS
jgi:hypothetical protein